MSTMIHSRKIRIEIVTGDRKKPQSRYRGPDGKLLTIGQVSLVVLAETLPLVYPSETGEAEHS